VSEQNVLPAVPSPCLVVLLPWRQDLPPLLQSEHPWLHVLMSLSWLVGYCWCWP